MNLSRRAFLQVFGIAAFGQLELPFFSYQTDAAIHGRALSNLTVYDSTHANAMAVRNMWADEVFQIHEQVGAHFRIHDGYVRANGVQPLIDNPHTSKTVPTTALPFWAEVVAPVSVIREYCAADSSIVTRIGHGGVMQVASQLTLDNGSVWYETCNQDGSTLGWVEAIQWDKVVSSPNLNSRQHRQITISRQNGRLLASEDDQPVFKTAAKVPSNLARGTYHISRSSVGGYTSAINQQTVYGVPHVLEINDRQQTRLFGAYWHNQFGDLSDRPTVEVNVHTAKWLYSWLGDTTTLVVD